MMASPKAEPKWAMPLRDVNDASTVIFEVEKTNYSHERTGRTMAEFHLTFRPRGVDPVESRKLFSTKDYNGLHNVVQTLAEMAKQGLLR